RAAPVREMTCAATRDVGRAVYRKSLALGRRDTGSLAFDRQCHTLAAANTQRGQPFMGVAAEHFVQKGHEDAATRRADRMTDRNGATVYVDLLRVPAELLTHRQRLRGESLVGFDQVDRLER